MTPERWQRLRSYFHEAFALDAAGRECLLAQLRSIDPELSTELEALLAEEPDEEFLSKCDSAEREFESSFQPERLGPYRVIRQLGRGGMGVVFEAIREDDGVRKTVAIKILTAPVLDRESVRQFRSERKALGELNHPNIARLLDWGELPDQQPYLVMEYVPEGMPIDRFSATNNLSVRETLQLLLAVCDALAHAHRHLIIHRDIKPANILVTSESQVKLLDFGIAKILDPNERTTRTGSRHFTPAYATPEQILGHPATTASDIYQIGVLAYELLANSLPYTDQARTDRIVWAVVNEIPKSPSEMVRGSRDRRRELRGDLDKIVLKALQKQPDRRYSSAEALANDLRNYMAGLPVSAQGDDWSYRTIKFIRRHAVSIAASLIVAISLAAGAGIAIWKERAAERERARAEDHARDLEKLAHSLIFDLHDSIADLPGATKARQELVSTALRYLDRLSAEEADDALKLDLAAAFEKMAQIQGDAFAPSMGDSEQALKSHDKARMILLTYWRNHPFNAQAGMLLFSSDLSTQIIADPATALPRLDQDAALAVEWVRARPGEPAALHAASNIFAMRDHIRAMTGDLAGSLDDCEHSSQLVSQIIRRWPGDWDDYASLASREADRGYALAKMDRLREALAAYDQSESKLAVATAMTTDSASVQREVAVIEGRRSQLLLFGGKTGASLLAIRHSLQMLQSLASGDLQDSSIRRDLALAYMRYGRVLLAEGRRQSALLALERAVRMFRELPKANMFVSGYDAQALNELGRALLRDRSAQSVNRAADCFQSAVTLLQRDLQLAPSNIELLRERARSTHGLAEVARIRFGGQGPEAIRLLRSALADWRSLQRRSPLNREGLEEQTDAGRELRFLDRR